MRDNKDHTHLIELKEKEKLLKFVQFWKDAVKISSLWLIEQKWFYDKNKHKEFTFVQYKPKTTILVTETTKLLFLKFRTKRTETTTLLVKENTSITKIKQALNWKKMMEALIITFNFNCWAKWRRWIAEADR